MLVCVPKMMIFISLSLLLHSNIDFPASERQSSSVSDISAKVGGARDQGCTFLRAL